MDITDLVFAIKEQTKVLRDIHYSIEEIRGSVDGLQTELELIGKQLINIEVNTDKLDEYGTDIGKIRTSLMMLHIDLVPGLLKE